MRKYYGNELIGRLSELFGPSGCENNVADFIISQIEDCADAFCTDRSGNVIAKICGQGGDYDKRSPKKVMISAHMDEVGVMVSDITEDGYIKFAPIGNIDPSVLCGRSVILGDHEKKIGGIIASKAIHMQSKEERVRAVPISKLNIDIGADSEEEARAVLDIGDVGVFDTRFASFGKDGRYLKGKALSGRVPCAAMIEVLRALSESRDPRSFDIYFAFTACEEIMFSSTKVAAQTVCPDIAIVLDSVEADDAGGGKSVCLGEGVAISFADKGAIYDHRLVELAISHGERENLKHQIKRNLSGKSGALHIQRAVGGVRVLSLAMPIRYMNSANSVADSEDYAALKDYIKSFVEFIRF